MTLPDPAADAAFERSALAVAAAWCASGATGWALRRRDGDVVVSEGVVDGTPTVSRELTGALRDHAIEVFGVTASPGRLDADAALLSELAGRTAELADITTALIGANDQLIAIYGLAESSTSTMQGHGLIAQLAADVQRLTRTDGVLIRFANGFEVDAGDERAVDAIRSHAGAERDLVVRADQVGGSYDVASRRLRGDSTGRILLAVDARRRFTTADLKLIDAVTFFLSGLISLELLHQAALTSAVIERDASTAAELARLLLPTGSPQTPGIDVAARCDPARLAAGDFYTWAETPEGIVFAVGDVSGKGLAAAMVMTMVTTATTRAALAARDADPHTLFAVLADELTTYLEDAGVFVTMLIGVYRPGADHLLLANAGHSPVIVRSGGRTEMVAPSAPPLGVLRNLVADTVSVPFAVGDALVVATDGLAEQEDGHGEQIGYERLVQLVDGKRFDTSQDLVDTLFAEVEQYAPDGERDDDRTALVIQRTGATP